MPKIITTFVRPPIPTPLWDWIAYYDGEDELGEYGYGETQAKAVADLTENYPRDPSQE